MSTILTLGIVLKSEPCREYDRQYIVYTEKLGKVFLLVKGGSKIVSKLAPHLEPFFVTNLIIANGRSLPRVAAAQVVKNYGAIRYDLSKIIIASYFLEVVDLLVKYDFKDKEVFKIIDEFLSSLANPRISPPLDKGRIKQGSNLIIHNKSLSQLLKHLGYQPQIKAKTQKQLASDFGRLIVEISEKPIKSSTLLERAVGDRN